MGFGIGQFRHFAGSMNFETTPRGLWARANRRPSSKPRSAAFTSSSGPSENVAAKSSGWSENRVSLEGDKLEVESERPLSVDPPASGAAARRRAGEALLPGRVKRRYRRATPLL